MRNVPVTGSARGETSRTRPTAETWVARERDGNLGVGRRVVLDPRGHIEHRVAPAVARDLDDHPSGADDFTDLRALCGHDAGDIGVEAGVAQTVFREGDLRLRRLDAGLGGLHGTSDCSNAARETAFSLTRSCIPPEVVARLAQLRTGRVDLRDCRLHAGRLVVRVEPRDELTGPHGVADVHRPLDEPAVDTKGLVDLSFGLDGAGQRDRIGCRALLNRSDADRADHLRWLLDGLSTGWKRRQRRQGHQERTGWISPEPCSEVRRQDDSPF